MKYKLSEKYPETGDYIALVSEDGYVVVGEVTCLDIDELDTGDDSPVCIETIWPYVTGDSEWWYMKVEDVQPPLPPLPDIDEDVLMEELILILNRLGDTLLQTCYPNLLKLRRLLNNV